MTQQGEHTWDIVVDYQRCPKCGFINESRDSFNYKKNSMSKEVICTRCKNTFVVEKSRKPTFGPLFGIPQPPEVTWE